MSSHRISCGIDLGTTNSAIAKMTRGKRVVVKSDVQHDTTPSAIAFGRKGRKRVGITAYNQLKRDRLRALERDVEEPNVFVEFKRTMGTDHVHVPNLAPQSSFNSEDLSAEVLKQLRGYLTDEMPRAAVVTIPAAFTVPQQQATLRAAKLAGFEQCRLLQEPVAAAMDYGLEERRGGSEKWLIFDFGGGTFDAALVLVTDGQITVKDTEGDNHLGGKDLDFSVVDQIILKRVNEECDLEQFLLGEPDRRARLRNALKKWAEQINITLSYHDSHFVESDLGEIVLPDGTEIDLDFEITRDRLRPVVKPIFQRAIDKTKTLMARHGLQGADIDELVLVGGPTYSPILREMLSEQIRTPNTSRDPMTVVACGAAFYGSTVEIDYETVRDPGRTDASSGRTLQLNVGYEATSINDEEFVTLKCRETSDMRRFGSLTVELRRRGWRSSTEPLTGDGVLLEVTLERNSPNVFELVVSTARGTRVKTNPSDITIIQGTKLTGSPLPNSLGIAVRGRDGYRQIFQSLKGAEKSKPLPVTGIYNGLSTSRQIRPGMPSDRLLISVFEGGADADGVRTIFWTHVGDYWLSGEQVNRVIPERSKFDLTIVTGPSSSIPETVTVDFPDFDEEFELERPDEGKTTHTGWIDREVVEAHAHIGRLRAGRHSDGIPTDKLEQEISAATNEIDRAGSDRDALEKGVEHLKEVLRKLYQFIDSNEWSDVEAELDEAWVELKKANAEEGHTASRLEMREARIRVDQVKAKQDPSLARELIQDLRMSHFKLKRCEWSKALIDWARRNYGSINWTNASQAKTEVTQGMRALAANKPCSDLLEHAGRIWELIVRDTDDYTGPPIPQL
ncbi:MAG: Hsp70 family protein [Gammaproteobacteria bacterium]|nr:Hsp70 family protein [Gammaproteobacteria bacterium]